MDNLTILVAQKNQKFSHKWGVFHWDDIIGKQYGTRVASRKRTRNHDGHVYVLRLTPEIMTAGAITHRTQVFFFFFFF